MTTAQKLANLLQTDTVLNALAEANNVAGILSAVNLQNRQRSNADLKTINAIVLAYGEEAAGTAASVLKTAAAQNPLLDAIYLKLCSTGISFADDRTQAMIDVLFTGELASLGANLKKLGVWYESQAEQELGTQATEQLVEDAMGLFAKRKLGLLLVARYNSVIALVEAGTVTDWETARLELGAE